jgi:hypothetical protein
MEVFRPSLFPPEQAWAIQLSPGHPPGPGPALPNTPAPGSVSRLGRPVVRPGWAGRSCPGWAGTALLIRAGIPPPRLGRIRRIRPGRDFSPSGRHLSTVPAGPGWDSPGLGRIITLQADLALSRLGFTSSGAYSSSGINSSASCQSWDTSRLRLARPPLLCWSWDAPWLRPAYSTSPSQSYPHEEDKTDDMEVKKTIARRRRPSTPRTDIDGTSP